MFVRGGAIIPTAPVSQYEGETPIDVLTLELYPAGGTSTFTLYEDDGISWAYRSGAFCKTTYTMSGIGDGFRLDIAARQGSYKPAPRSCLLGIHHWPGHSLTPTLNDAPLPEQTGRAAFDAAPQGYFLDPATNILHTRFPDPGESAIFSLA